MMPIWLSNLRERSLATRTAVLMLVLAGIFLLVAPVAWYGSGPSGLVWAAVAGLSCLAGSGLALAASEPFRSTRRALRAMLLGMLFRLGVPSAAAVAVYVCGQGPGQAGFFYYLVVFFEVALVVEVFLSLPPKAAGEKTPGGPGRPAS